MLSRAEILAFRRRTGGLQERLPAGDASLERAASAGLTDSTPRAALLGLHARVEGVDPAAWDRPPLTQVWGLRNSVYVIAQRDWALFTLARLSDANRARAEGWADRLREFLGDGRMTDAEIGKALGVNPASFKYAAPTGTVAIRWDGARAPDLWLVDAPDVDPPTARAELARRFLHTCGPSTAEGFADWAGIKPPVAETTFAGLDLLPVRTPLGDEWLLPEDEPDLRIATEDAPARLLPSGDNYFLLTGDRRALLIPDAEHRDLLWTSRVWPGALLVDGEIRGTWRRSQHRVTIAPWTRLSAAARQAAEAEAQSFPLPGVERAVEIDWLER